MAVLIASNLPVVNSDTFHSIGIVWDILGDADHNATVTVQYKKAADSTWLDGMNLIRNDYEWFYNTNNSTNESVNNFSGSLMFLTPSTAYDLKLTYTDPDAVEQTRVVELTATTRSVPVKTATGSTYYVDPAATGPLYNGSSGDPFETIAQADAAISAGDTVKLRTGDYTGVSAISADGAEDNYIVWETDTAASPVIRELEIRCRGGWVWIQGLTFTSVNEIGGENAAVETRGLHVPFNATPYEPNDMVIIDNTITGFNDCLAPRWTPETGGDRWTIMDNVIRGDKPADAGSRGVYGFLIDAQDETNYSVFAGGTLYSVAEIITMDCGSLVTVDAVSGGVVTQFTVDSTSAVSAHQDDDVVGCTVSGSDGSGNDDFTLTAAATNLSGQANGSGWGIMESVGVGNVYAYNTISSVGDGIGHNSNQDIYGNLIDNCSDDSFTGDTSYGNTRVWGNKAYESQFYHLTFQPQRAGPWYILYNQFRQETGQLFKWKVPDRSVFINNTLIGNNAPTPELMRCFTRNNLFINNTGTIVWGGGVDVGDADERATQYTVEWNTDTDYDGWGWNTPSSNPFRHDSTNYADLAAFQSAVGVQLNGVEVDFATIFLDNTGVGATNLELDSNTNHSGDDVVATGNIVSNLADFDYLGALPDYGCHHRSVTPPHYGVRTSELGDALADRTDPWSKH